MGKYGFRIGKEKEYRSWRSMQTRCFNPNHEAYTRYKNKTICDRWLGPDGFQHFYEDMGPRPDRYTLDRIDNNEGYYPENCRWTSIKKQGNNRGDNVRLTFNGETLTMSEWSDRLGVKYTTIHERIRRGMSVEQALTQKVQTKHLERAKKARANGLDPHLVSRRILDGWCEEDALTKPKMKNQFG